MTVWPVSWSVETRKVGSSWTSRPSACAHLLLVGLRLRLDGELDDRIGEVHLLEDHRVVRIAQRVAGGDALEAGQGDDVAGARFLHVLAVVGVHQQHAADALLAVLGAVQHAGRRFEHARIDAREGERADERVGHDLEGQRRERRVVARRQRDRLVGAHLDALDVGHVGRRRQVVDDGVEHGLHALVLERRAAQHRHERVGDRALADALDQRVVVGLLAAPGTSRAPRRPARRPSRAACGATRRPAP